MSSQLTLETLRASLQAVDRAALLVEPRILRRVIRLDRRLAGLGLFVPHRRSYTIGRERLLAFVDRVELELPPEAELPRSVILLIKPSDEESLDLIPTTHALTLYWRLLFHSRVHMEMERRIAEHPLQDQLAIQRREQIGASSFSEIRQVLLKDEYLFPDPSDLETYIEFAAVYLEMRYFAESDLHLYFPAIRDWGEIDRIVSQDVYHSQLITSTRLAGIASLDELSASQTFEADAADGRSVPTGTPASSAKPSATAPWPARYRKFMASADRAAALGNSVKAASLRWRAAQWARGEQATWAVTAAHNEIERLVQRLRPVLQLSEEEVRDWNAALQPFLEPASRGFWSPEARLLYDLQKVCTEHERGVFKLDLIEWCRTLGQRPIRRRLPLLREVLTTRHLRNADRRVLTAHVSASARQRLTRLMAEAVSRVERRSRDSIRPRIVQVFDSVGLTPNNVPEQVGRRKIVEELLDHIVDHGFINMGDLRDGLSKNDLKLPDISGLPELLHGDHLLRADRQLATALDGIYRPGAVYLRWPQRLSSLMFGTAAGRFVTQYLAIPFGGAYLILEGARHLMAAITSHAPPITGTAQALASVALLDSSAPRPLPQMPRPAPDLPASELTYAPNPGLYFLSILVLGTLILLLLHRPRFRAWCSDIIRGVWQILHRVLVDLPTVFLRSPLVQWVRGSAAYAAVRSYLIRPVLLSLLIWYPSHIAGTLWDRRDFIEVALLAALFINSPVGRYADEWLTDLMARAWHELRMRVFGAIYQWIMDWFHRVVVALERVVYAVDELLRFRTGDRRIFQFVKLVAGTIWFFVAYVIMFVFTLLVEPQINPIKHFPVVTVSHKLILPTGPAFVRHLESYTYIDRPLANTIVWSTIWMIPGVFGFLVWELKENWRLYGANRPRALVPIPIGQHGETMVRLLRPGLHSGTLPRLFASLRLAARKSEVMPDRPEADRWWAAVHHVEKSVRHFVQRDFLELLAESRLPVDDLISLGEVRVATNCVEVQLRHDRHPGTPASLRWDENRGELRAHVASPGWMEHLCEGERERLRLAITGLFHRSGAEYVEGPFIIPGFPPVPWQEWIQAWKSNDRNGDLT